MATSATFYPYLYDAGGRGTVAIELRRAASWWACPLYWGTKPKTYGYTSRNISSNAEWKSWDVTNLVRSYWIGRNFGTSPNFGFELRGPEGGAPNLAEGGYNACLTVWHQGQSTGEVCDSVLMLAGQIACFDVPASVRLGESAAFRVTLANYGNGALESDLSLALATESGEPYAVLPVQSPSIPGGGQVDAVFTWDSTGTE